MAIYTITCVEVLNIAHACLINTSITLFVGMFTLQPIFYTNCSILLLSNQPSLHSGVDVDHPCFNSVCN